MFAMYSTPSLSDNLTGSREGYVQLSTIRNDKNFDLDFSSSPRKSKSCLSGFLAFLYHYFVSFLRLLCFRLPRNVDNESLINVEYKGEEQECEADREVPIIVLNPCFRDNPSGQAEDSDDSYLEWKRTHPCQLAVSEIRASQIKGGVIAGKGKAQLSASKAVVSKGILELKEMQNEIVNLRDNMETARKLFLDVEKGIKEYRWDAVAHETRASIEYNGKLCVFPLASTNKYILTPFEQMYWDHKIFIEEMKYHFKWNHGIML